MSSQHTVYTDDPDAYWAPSITSAAGIDLDWTPVEVAAGSGEYEIAATWQGDPGTTRTLKVPLDTLPAGHFALYLKVPGGNDFQLGVVAVLERS